ncbi:MAG TPA: dTMP kinase [Candidatus Sulfotelmatobacter sp.]|jgi:thymidylate kinase
MTAKIVSFSGIDGAGKSTQISALETWLRETGHTTRLLTFWDDIVVGSRFREAMSHAAFKGDEGVGSPEKPLERRDKNVTSWPVIAARFFLYFADAINLCRTVVQARRSNFDVVIFDRYIYDELANLPLKRWPARAFIWAMLKIVPKPDVAYIVDADPEAARARKPEYPLEFLRSNREAYLSLARFSRNIAVIEPLSIDAAKIRIQQEFLRAQPDAKEGSTGPDFCSETAK